VVRLWLIAACVALLLADGARSSVHCQARPWVALEREADRYSREGRYEDALQFTAQALELKTAALPAGDELILQSLNSMALYQGSLGRYAEAEALLLQALRAGEAVGRIDRAYVARLENLANIMVGQGRHDEAEKILRKSLDITTARYSERHIAVALVLGHLAHNLRGKGRTTEAEALFRRRVSIWQDWPGKRSLLQSWFEEDIWTALTTGGAAEGNLAFALSDWGGALVALARYDEAEPPLLRAVALFERASLAGLPFALERLAQLSEARGQHGQAESFLRQSIDATRRAHPSHAQPAAIERSLAAFLQRRGRLEEAAAIYAKVLEETRQLQPPDHPMQIRARLDLASVHDVRRRYTQAAMLTREASRIALDRARRVDRLTGLARHELSSEQTGSALDWHIAMIWRLTGRFPNSPRAMELGGEALQLAQEMVAGSASLSIEQMAARAAVRSPQLIGLVRREQDLQGERLRVRAAALAARSDLPRAKAELQRLEDRSAAIDSALDELRARLAASDPGFSSLMAAKPLGIADIQSRIGDNRVLVMIHATVGDTFAWIIAKDSATWKPIGSSANLMDQVRALRCGLDATAWRDAGADRCGQVLGKTYTEEDAEEGRPPPFDLERSHALYRDILGGAETVMRNADGSWKELIVVASGPLAQLPFQVLVTAKPGQRIADDAAAPMDVRWLASRQAITVLPSVASLDLLQHAGPSAARNAFIGVGNPRLDGTEHLKDRQRLRGLAAAWQRCSLTDLDGACRGVFPKTTSGRPMTPAVIRAWTPLPETACELCAIARNVAAEPGRDVLLGEDATESRIKSLGTVEAGQTRSRLQDYRVIHIATHGMVTNLAAGYAEPGLILTPPADGRASEEDDGYLSASEIAGLSLDADWVVLSACNTAAGGAERAEVLSGLARAFFYAGARSLLVTNWEVHTTAAVDVTTRSVVAFLRHGAGRAEALKSTLSQMIEEARASRDPVRLHPSYWGAFSLVGLGGR
jgi:CHAT domain-containing protein/tetratricopeptide (TPR) repeat protein